MGCAESADAQDPIEPQKSRRTVDIKPTTSHLISKPDHEGEVRVETSSSGVKT